MKRRCNNNKRSRDKEKGVKDMKRIRTFMIGALCNRKGMEMVQVAILVAIAVAVGIIFKSSIVDFVNRIFGNLNAANF